MNVGQVAIYTGTVVKTNLVALWLLFLNFLAISKATRHAILAYSSSGRTKEK